MRRFRLTLLGATTLVTVLCLLTAGSALARTDPPRRTETNGGVAPVVQAEAAAATLTCARRAGWQRWYATPSRANAVGAWACGWYNSRVYDLVGRVWDTQPSDGVAASLRITWGDGTSQTLGGTPEGRAFSLHNPVPGTPPLIRECEAACGVATRPDYLPERNKRAGVFRVMTYNVHHGYDNSYTDLAKACYEGKTTLWKTASTIRRNDPDIVVVNEINQALNINDEEPDPCDVANQPRELANALGMKYVYCNDWHGPEGNRECDVSSRTNNTGNAILSRYPMTFKGHQVLPHTPEVEHAKRGLIWAEISVAGKPITVYGTHLAAGAPKKELRRQQLTAILTTMAQNGHYPEYSRVIFAGDMNTDDPEELRLLGGDGRRFNDAFKHISPDWIGNTMPVKDSRSQTEHRIDYIFTSPLFRHPTRGTAVPWSQSSDHLPVIVDIYQ